MNDRLAFLAHIEENPADWQSRLIFADWLDEHNDEFHANVQRDIAKELQRAALVLWKRRNGYLRMYFTDGPVLCASNDFGPADTNFVHPEKALRVLEYYEIVKQEEGVTLEQFGHLLLGRTATGFAGVRLHMAAQRASGPFTSDPS